jgi:hypothetical protein
MRDVKATTPGNAEVIAGLQVALDRAKSGIARACALVFCEHQGADVMYMGDVDARAQIMYGCNLLNHLILTGTSNHVNHAQGSDKGPPANLWKYDLTCDPMCFDFLPWLVTAEMARRQEQAPGPLKLAFVRNPNALMKIDDSKWQFFHNVMRPILKMFNAVESEEAVHGRHAPFVGLRTIADRYNRGEMVPQIEVPAIAMGSMQAYLKGRKPVTITLRELPNRYEQRNSDVEEWLKFARWLTRKGEDVIILRDTVVAGEALDGFETFPEASRDIVTRAALYESAKCNTFVANGPWGLANYSKVPWLLFAIVDNNQPDGFNRPEYWDMFMGLNEQHQLPWATDKQKIIFARDKFDNLRGAYEELRL